MGASLCGELIARNSADGDQYLYMQVTRGAELGRNHAWPQGLKPTLFAYADGARARAPRFLDEGVAAVTAADTRWARRDIKSTALLANVLLKKLAVDAGAFETILLERRRTHRRLLDHRARRAGGAIRHAAERPHILPGTTRDVVAELAPALEIGSA